jgi:hypothetical protein
MVLAVKLGDIYRCKHRRRRLVLINVKPLQAGERLHETIFKLYELLSSQSAKSKP